jgi:hypothetical protein
MYDQQDIKVQTGTFHAHTSYWMNAEVARQIATFQREDDKKDRRQGERTARSPWRAQACSLAMIASAICEVPTAVGSLRSGFMS